MRRLRRVAKIGVDQSASDVRSFRSPHAHPDEEDA